MSVYAPTRTVLLRLGEAASARIPTGFAHTLPCPLRADPHAPLRCVYYAESGRPGQRTVHPPEWVADLDGASGAVLRFAPCNGEPGTTPPFIPVPGAGIDPTMDGDTFWRRRERVYDLLPATWEHYARHAPRAPDDDELLRVWWTITKAEVAPFQVGVTPDFFHWLRGDGSRV